MPFYNIPSTEAMGLAEYGERSKDPKIGSGDTAFLDHVVRLTERRLYKYALTQVKDEHERAATPPGDGDGTGKTTSPEKAKEEPTTDPSVTVERPLPYPSLFLNTPHALVRCSWASRDDVETRHAAAAKLSQRLPAPPPSYLLVSPSDENATVSKKGTKTKGDNQEASASAVDGSAPAMPDWADVQQLSKAQQPPHLSQDGAQTLAMAAEMPHREETRMPFSLDLARDRRARERVNVVLQSEVGLSLSTPLPPSQTSSSPSNTQQPPEMFIMSPDATSCVLVACRVSLHPRWRVQSRASVNDAETEAASEHTAVETFAETCAQTTTAAMGHFDSGTDATEAALHEMVWQAAVPAWLHTIVEHYHSLVQQPQQPKEEEGDPAEVNRGSASFCDSRLRDAEAALAVLQGALVAAAAATPDVRGSQAKHGDEDDILVESDVVIGPDSAPLSLLHVEWYVVGGIRMRQHAAPTLGRIFRAFFPMPTSASSSALLATSRPLRDLLAHGKGNKTSAGAPSATTDITVQHRLREDGLCFWSLNTYVSHWAVDTQNPGRRYAFPMCLGLLLRLGDGASWPVKVKPGTRAYPLARLRRIVCEGVRWIVPVERPATGYAQLFWRKARGKGNAGELVTGELVTTALASPARRGDRAVACLLDDGAPEHTSASGVVRSGPRGAQKSGQSAVPMRLITLSGYVKQCLATLAHWAAAAESSAGTASSILHLFPLVLDASRSWSELDVVCSGHLLTMPDVFFLQFSTTPHCEPEDFGAESRGNCEMMMTWKHREVFAPSTDGLLFNGLTTTNA